MAFTTTLLNQQQGPIPDGGFAKEIWRYENTLGSTGGTVTAKYLKSIVAVVGPYLNRTISGATTTITTDVNAVGEIEIFGRT